VASWSLLTESEKLGIWKTEKMKICRIVGKNRQPEYAIYGKKGIVPLANVMDVPPTDNSFFGQISDIAMAIHSADPDRLSWEPRPRTLLPPVPSPEKILCIGLNYLDHAIETGAEPPTEPVVFSKFNTALVGDGDSIVLPRLSHQVDYEAELVVVIGSTARHVSVSDAMSHVIGYTCGHDVSARDWQKGRPGGQWLLGKSFDTFAPLGPCLVTSDEITDPANLSVKMHLRDELVQSSTTAQLIFDIPTLISHLSQIMTLKAGDLIFTGTPSGVGAARKPPRFLRDGDVCVVEIDGIGRLSNRCIAEVAQD
jgi:2-keto-4-pentenoate hydratase/2-oxohepta-3-ene-1,7-dioic acid hydratase in catechol pathway